MQIIEFLIKIIFLQVVGISSRYIFYSLIGKKKSFEYLLGKNLNEVEQNKQHFYNAIVGLIAGFVVIILIFYLIFGIF